MSDLARQKLCEIIARYGTSVCEEPLRCKGLLKDLCRGEHTREINVLALALEEQVAAKLLAASGQIPLEMLVGRLVKQLEEKHWTSEDAARWAVETWAVALGKVPSAELAVCREPIVEPAEPRPASLSPATPKAPEPSPRKTRSVPELLQRLEHRVSPFNLTDRAELVFIPAGEFVMGSNDYDREKPQRRVYLDGYWIYKNLVTVAQYKQFCQATGRQMPTAPSWGWKDDHPIVEVDWAEAQAYSVWAGAALPTEAQWEKAARGTDGRVYPWGNVWDASKCRCSKKEGGDAGSTSAVGSYPSGASPYGVLDMAGNVWEWCADWYGEDYYKSAPSQNPVGPWLGTRRVLRGGSWDSLNPNSFRCANRNYNYPSNRDDVRRRVPVRASCGLRLACVL